ncbi:CHDC2 [Bugula neritina]|uniref:CHDC2 n=1 Tax=Bugula neritina TaxID=10212 RepID=A0A7J7JQ45_BUGNE|nr:CHDC2 [Bugula neritina]
MTPNILQVVNAMRYIGIDYDIQAIDITDPNPVSLLMLCVYLCQKLPMYLPKITVTLSGALHQTVQRQIYTQVLQQMYEAYSTDARELFNRCTRVIQQMYMSSKVS